MPTPPNYFALRPESSFDQGVRKALKGEALTSDEDFDTLAQNLSAEQIKVLFGKAARSDQEKQAQAESLENAATFVELHPEYLKTPANSALMQHELATMGIENPTVQDLERAYEQLRASNFLKLSQTELSRQQKAAAQDRANTIRNEAFNEEDAYGLDLDEVRRRANAVMGRR